GYVLLFHTRSTGSATPSDSLSCVHGPKRTSQLPDSDGSGNGSASGEVESGSSVGGRGFASSCPNACVLTVIGSVSARSTRNRWILIIKLLCQIFAAAAENVIRFIQESLAPMATHADVHRKSLSMR